MDRLSSSSSSSQARFRESFNENIEDPVSTGLRTRAVTEEAIESKCSTKDDYIKLLFAYLENTEVQKSPELVQLFETQIESLMSDESIELSAQEAQSYKWAKQLLVDNKVSSFAQRKLFEISSLSASPSQSSSSGAMPTASTCATPSSSSSFHDSSSEQGFPPPSSAAIDLPVNPQPDLSSDSQSNSSPKPFGSSFSASSQYQSGAMVLSLSAHLEPQRELSEIAFGKAKWARYFGDIGIEPPLPPNINEILNSPCIFKPDKRVYQTHVLVLIPNTVDGKSFHLDALRELIQNPKEGFKAQYRCYNDYVKQELWTKSQPSHWVLMTRNVIPESRNKGYDDQRALVQSRARESGIPYELPTALELTTAILLEYVQTGIRLYGDNPWTYTRCKERVYVDGRYWPLAIGGFSKDSLGICYDDHWHVIGIHCGLGALRKF